jgi:hypothetical protein
VTKLVEELIWRAHPDRSRFSKPVGLPLYSRNVKATNIQIDRTFIIMYR